MMDYTCNVFAIAVAFASFIIRAEGSFGTEARYGRDNKSRGKRDRLSPRLGEVCETIDCFASRTPFIFSLLVSRSRDIVPPSRHCLTDDINGIRIKGMRKRKRVGSFTIVSKSFLARHPLYPRHYYSAQHPPLCHCHRRRWENKTTLTCKRKRKITISIRRDSSKFASRNEIQLYL